MRPKTYWHIISNLFTSPQYYLKILKAPLGFSFRFFIVSMIILGFSWTWRINQRIMPAAQQQLSDGLDELAANYPVELEITWDKNQLQSSTTEAVEVPYPSSIEHNSQLPPLLGNFIAEDISAEQFSTKFKRTSLFVVTNNKFFVNNLQQVWTETTLTDILPPVETVLNKETVSELIPQLKDQLEKIIELAKQLNFIIMPLLLIMIRLGMAFLEAILVFLFFKLNQFNFKFSQVLQLSLHLVVVSEIINQVTAWIYPQLQISMLTLAYWSIFSYVFWTQRKHFLSFKNKPTPQG